MYFYKPAVLEAAMAQLVTATLKIMIACLLHFSGFGLRYHKNYQYSNGLSCVTNSIYLKFIIFYMMLLSLMIWQLVLFILLSNLVRIILSFISVQIVINCEVPIYHQRFMNICIRFISIIYKTDLYDISNCYSALKHAFIGRYHRLLPSCC